MCPNIRVRCPEMSLIDRGVMLFTLKLYNKNSVPRNCVDDFLDFSKEFLQEFFFSSLLDQIKTNLQNNPSKPALDVINTVFETNKDPFMKFSTEYRRFAFYEQEGFYVKPVDIVIGETPVEKKKGNTIVTEPEKVFIQSIPLYHTFKIFLEIPGVFFALKKHMLLLKSEKNILSNKIQAEAWKRASLNHGSKFFIPFDIFCDEAEMGDPLASHAGVNKLLCTYVSIPCLPSHLISRLSNIFLCFLCYANDRKVFGNKAIFQNLIDEINLLKQNGITLDINNRKHHVYFELCSFRGDNLGLNGILGFVECFIAYFFCRICKMDKKTCKRATREDESLLRTVSNYAADLETNDVQKTGLKTECTFHDIEGWHNCNNQCVDIMHDHWEGVVPNDLAQILYSLIIDLKLFTFETLNERISTFNYGKYESKVPEIKLDHLKKKHLKMSAAESATFCRCFGLLFGDLIPKDDKKAQKVWRLYILLRDVSDIISSPRMSPAYPDLLEIAIHDHHTLYYELYGDGIPKMHLETHYPRMIRENGPVVNDSAMRFEAKHQELKATAAASKCKKNLLKTLAIKHQLKFCYHAHRTDILEEVDYGPEVEVDQVEINTYFPHLHNRLKIKSTDSITIWGTCYSKDTVIVSDIDEREGPEFGMIQKIYYVEDKIYFLMYRLPVVEFHDKFYAYKVTIDESALHIKLKSKTPLIHPCLFTKKGSEFFVTPKYKI